MLSFQYKFRFELNVNKMGCQKQSIFLVLNKNMKGKL